MALHDVKPTADKTRISVTFSAEDYKEIEQIAAKQRVSVAWVVRDAVAGYLSQRSPLFLQRKNQQYADSSR